MSVLRRHGRAPYGYQFRPRVPQDVEESSDSEADELSSDSSAAEDEPEPTIAPTPCIPGAEPPTITPKLKAAEDEIDPDTEDEPEPTDTSTPSTITPEGKQEARPTKTGGFGESRAWITTTFTPTPTNLAAAATDSDTDKATQTVVVTVPLPRPPLRKAISDGTEHLLVAAGSICATLLLILIIYGLYVRRKKSLTFRDVMKFSRRSRSNSNAGASGPRRVRNWTTPAYAWGRKEPFHHGSMKALPTTPPAAVARSNTDASDRPLIMASRSPSISTSRNPSTRRPATAASSPPRSFLEETSPPPAPPPPLRTHTRTHSRTTNATPGSPVLPPQTQRESQSPRQTCDVSEQPSPPSFRQFLFNRRFSAPKVSRFSWTTAQTPQTPRDPRDFRVSIATSRSSIPRFRTIDSWVNQQVDRLEEQRLREFQHAAQEQESMPVPNVPKHYRQSTSVTMVSDVPVFQQHPGTEVALPRGSLVPSEVLNSKTLPPTL